MNSRKKFLHVIKETTETVNNSTTFQSDDELLFKVSANKHYAGFVVLYTDSGPTPDFKFQIIAPSGATGFVGNANVSSNTPIAPTALAGSITSIQIAGNNQIFIPFTIIMSSTKGTCNIQWAQNTQDASDTKVVLGSYLMVFEQ